MNLRPDTAALLADLRRLNVRVELDPATADGLLLFGTMDAALIARVRCNKPELLRALRDVELPHLARMRTIGLCQRYRWPLSRALRLLDMWQVPHRDLCVLAYDDDADGLASWTCRTLAFDDAREVRR